jgi:hypothetical protein
LTHIATKGLGDHRRDQLDKGCASTDLHLPKQGLTLVDAHTASSTHRISAIRLRQPLLIDRVTRLVDDAHQALGELIFIIAGRDAHIAGSTATEGVKAHVEATMIKIKAEHLHHLQPELFLRVD